MADQGIFRALAHLRLVGFLEGVSYLILLGIAMPLKYMADRPEAVRVVGSIHGALFVLFVIAVGRVWSRASWPLSRVTGALVASVVPFGTFFLDRQLRDDQRSL
jgi:integral membrane protein